MNRTARFWLLCLAVLATSLATSCGGGDADGGAGDGGGETRRFDQHPTLLGIEGNGVIEAGQQATLHVAADIDFARNESISFDETFGVDMTAGVPVSPGRVRLLLEDDSYLAPLAVTAPAVGVVTRYEIQARNPRNAVAREIFVVPVGTLYVKALTAERGVVLAGGSVQATLELSSMVSAGSSVQVALAASTTQVTLPATVTVPELSRTVSFPISGGQIVGEVYLRISATLNGATQSTGLWLRSATPFLRHLAVPGHLASDPANPSTETGTAYLSSPVPAGASVSLASNNSLVQVPASVAVDTGSKQVAFPIVVSPFGDFTAVRFTASYGGVEKVADSTVGFRTGDAQLAGLLVDGESNEIARRQLLGSCSFPLVANVIRLRASRIAFVDLTLSDPAPADARIEVFSSKRLAAEAYAEVIVPAGQTRFSFQLAVDPGALITDEVRFLRLRARVKSTGQELSEPIIAFNSNADFVAVDIQEVLLSDPAYFGNTNARFEVVLTRAHTVDDVPVRLSLHEAASGIELAFVDTAVFAGTSSRVVSLPLPAVAPGTLVEIRATQGSPRSDGGWCGIADTPRARSISFAVLPAQTGLISLSPAPAALFAGQSSDVTLRLGGPAAADTRVALASTLPTTVLAGVPADVVIPAGQSTASFTVTAASNVSFISSGTLSATLNGATQTAAIHVLAEPSSVRVVLTPASVTSGQPVSVRVDLSPTYPVPMDVLLTSDRAALPIPAALRVAANQASAMTTITAGSVTMAETVSVTARLRGLSSFQSIVVMPAPPTGWRVLASDLAGSLVFDLTSAVAVDANGQAFVSYIQTVGTQGRISVRRDGNVFPSPWLPVGVFSTGFQTFSATSLDLAIDAGGRAVVAFGMDLDAIAAWRYNDVSLQWESLSDRLNLTNNAGSSLQIGLAGNAPNMQSIIVAWVENGQIAVRRYSMATQSWDAGAFVPGIANVRSIRMMLDASGAPVIAYWAGSLRVVRESASGVWTQLGGDLNTLGADVNGVTRFGVHVDSGGIVRVVWVEGINPWHIYARRFDGVNWVSAALNLTNGEVAQGGTAVGLEFPDSIVVARNPSVFAFATAWESSATGHSFVRLLSLATDTMLTGVVPIDQTGTYLRARRISLAMQDANRPIVTSSHHEPGASIPHVLQVRRYMP